MSKKFYKEIENVESLVDEGNIRGAYMRLLEIKPESLSERDKSEFFDTAGAVGFSLIHSLLYYGIIPNWDRYRSENDSACLDFSQKALGNIDSVVLDLDNPSYGLNGSSELRKHMRLVDAYRELIFRESSDLND